jgi:CRP-like cAMP-binding protein
MGSEAIKIILRKCELFSDLSEQELSSIAALGRIEEYEAGGLIYKRGALGTRLYVLSKGQVSLVRRIKLDDTRIADATVYILREHPLRRLMGCWCTLVGKQHIQMCSARCDKPSQVVSIGCTRLRELIVKNPNMRLRILEKLVLIMRERLESSYVAMETL